MAYTQQQAEALRQAMASGVLTVEYDGKRVTYRSVGEIREALAEVDAALARDEGRRVRQIRIDTNKGF
jgi:hypothetical protein